MPESYSQEIPVNTEQQFEGLANAEENESEDDSYLQELENFRRHPVNLNTADIEDLRQLKILSDLQIMNFISYRNLFGNLLSVYELQAVPSWDINTTRKLLPFIKVASPVVIKEELGKRFRGGEHSLVLRVSQVLERSRGFKNSTNGTSYTGSPQRIFFRYRYNYKNLLQFGWVGDKDAGEQFFKGAQSKGFDFYSFHLFIRKLGVIQCLALGDFSVSMGQGLIEWQGLAFRKSSDVMAVKRQSAVLRPYSSSGEFNFHRGAGITIRKKNWEYTSFISLRKVDGNRNTDTLNRADVISSFLSSGYHRTASELIDRHSLSQTAIGTTIQYRYRQLQVGVNGIYYKFSLPIEKREEPYNLYAIKGDQWYNASIDYSYTHKNFHVFGEAAIDKQKSLAFVNGLLISINSFVDVSIMQRFIPATYQCIHGNVFTESTSTSNEAGVYIGVTVIPRAGWRVDIYSDIYKFPWLKYLVDAPTVGKDFLAQLTYMPNRQVELQSRFRSETKQINQPGNTTTTNSIVSVPRQSWRTQVNYKWNSSFALRNRIELLWYDHKGVNREMGFLSFMDIIYKPPLSSYSGIFRIQYFETGGYNSRLYAYENDVLYSYSIPVFFDKGFRYALTLNYDLTPGISFWLRLGQTNYRAKSTIGSGLDEIPGNRKTEVKAQVRWIF